MRPAARFDYGGSHVDRRWTESRAGRALRVTGHQPRVAMTFRCAFTILSDTRYLPFLREWVKAAAIASGRGPLSPKTAQATTLALIEAVDNAIFHARPRRAAKRGGRGRRGRSNLPIGVSIAVADGHMAIEVADCGRGIGRRLAARPDEMVEHGRGLFLIHRLAFRVVSRMRGGRHFLKMVFPL